MQTVNGALAATRQPRSPMTTPEPEREIITHTHEKICAFSQNERNEIAVILFIASFFLPRTGGRVGECEPVVCGLAEHVGFLNGV